MIDGKKVVAFTPMGRKRYVDLLIPHMKRELDAGHIDHWILFNNPIVPQEGGLSAQIQIVLGEDRVTILENNAEDHEGRRHTSTIATFYRQIPVDPDAIYIRLDDDIVFIDKDAIERLVRFRIAHPEPFLVYPAIVNNVRISHYMQQAGHLPVEAFGEIKNEITNLTAWTHDRFINLLHTRTLHAIAEDALVEAYKLPDMFFDSYESGYISVNCYCILGHDLAGSQNTLPENGDEERYFALWEPERRKRFNALCGDAVVVHFAYHKQEVYMDRTGMLGDYARFVEPVDFMTVVAPPPALDPNVEQRFYPSAERRRLIDVLQIPEPEQKQ